LNEFFDRTIAQGSGINPAKSHGTSRLHVQYITQISVRPPTFVVFTAGGKAGLHFSFVRHLENRMREEFGFPGMRVLQFAFGGDATNDHLPHNHTRETVVYTGTHDNDTTVGWWENLDSGQREYCLQYLASDGTEINWDMIRAAMASVADTAIIPMQDVLGLASDARMNLPASTTGNWTWRMKDKVVPEGLSGRLRELTEVYGRIGGF